MTITSHKLHGAIAVVTPYHREPVDTLERCHRSVATQTIPCRHIMVADGAPNSSLDVWNVDHLVLPQAHGDNGNTPRAVGALSALARGFDLIAFLDADNWYAPDHLEQAAQVALEAGAAVVCSDRHIILSTGELCQAEDEDVRAHTFADTSSFVFSHAAARALPVWAMMDLALSPICDRIMSAALASLALSVAWTNRKTVFYESRWANHFAALGKPPPPDEHVTDWPRIREGYDRDRQLARLGFDPFTAGRPF
jgi:glycosyltransferase involved in cell wall biosynthesis